MSSIIVKTKNKKQEKILKAFLEKQEMDYSSVAEEEVVYTSKKRTTPEKNNSAKEKQIAGIKEAVRQVNLIKQGKLKARPVQELLDEL